MLRCPPNCPLCYSNHRGRSNYRGHRGYRCPRYQKGVSVAQFLKGRPPVDGSGSSGVVSLDDGFTARWPVLSEWMTVTQWDGGEPRQTATLFFFVEGGALKLLFKDRDAGRVAFFSGDCLVGLCDDVEARLVAGSMEWRADRPAPGRSRTK